MVSDGVGGAKCKGVSVGVVLSWPSEIKLISMDGKIHKIHGAGCGSAGRAVIYQSEDLLFEFQFLLALCHSCAADGSALN